MKRKKPNQSDDRPLKKRKVVKQLKASSQLSSTISEKDAENSITAHDAGFDAYMTGYVYAYFAKRYIHVAERETNKLYISGKAFPFTIRELKRKGK